MRIAPTPLPRSAGEGGAIIAVVLLVFTAINTVNAAPPVTPPSPAERGRGVGAIALVAPSYAYSVAFSPDNKRVAVGGYKRITLYEVETGKRVAQYVVGKDAVRSVAFSADGTRLAAASGIPATGGTVAVIDATNGKSIRMLSGHDDTVEGVAFAGNLVLSAAD
ncbi:MAG: hypothetical protein H8F28_13555, partial [Fibrella sp.]|nr:hypothetical protein [Armatimonadota bacterium]